MKSVKAVPERMFLFRVLDVLDRILLFRVFNLFTFEFNTGSSSSIPFVLFRVLDFVESVFSLPSASLAPAELFSLCSLSFFRVSDL